MSHRKGFDGDLISHPLRSHELDLGGIDFCQTIVRTTPGRNPEPRSPHLGNGCQPVIDQPLRSRMRTGGTRPLRRIAQRFWLCAINLGPDFCLATFSSLPCNCQIQFVGRYGLK